MNFRFQVTIELAGGTWTAGWANELEETLKILDEYKGYRSTIWDKVECTHLYSEDSIWRKS